MRDQHINPSYTVFYHPHKSMINMESLWQFPNCEHDMEEHMEIYIDSPIHPKFDLKTVFSLLGPLSSYFGPPKNLVREGHKRDALLQELRLFQVTSLAYVAKLAHQHRCKISMIKISYIIDISYQIY